MAEFTTPKNSLIASMASASGSFSAAASDDDFEHACSICFEPFVPGDPSTVTTCKHEYHLRCILEWSQRSKECPICWQSYSLKDPTSQELLAAVDMEKNARKRHVSSNGPIYPHHYQESDSECWNDDPDFNRRIMRHLAAMTRRARQGHRTVGRRTSEWSPPALMFPSRESYSTMHPNTPEERSFSNASLGGSSPTSSRSSVDMQRASFPCPSFVELSSGSVPMRDIRNHSRPLESQSSDVTQKLRSSELLAFSESIKSRLSAASTRYKDSISKGTQGFREKFLAHNNSVKEISKGVQREMNASITSIARMIERLDLKSKRNSCTGEGFSRAAQTSNYFPKGKGVLDDIIANSHENHVLINQGLNYDQQSQAACSMPSHVDIHHGEGGN